MGTQDMLPALYSFIHGVGAKKGEDDSVFARQVF
jgi:hypothetical protein